MPDRLTVNSTYPPLQQASSVQSSDVTGRAVLLVEKLSLWNMPVLKALSWFGFDVHYMFYPDYLKKRGRSPEDVAVHLSKKGFTKFDFAAHSGSDPYGYERHAPAYAKQVFGELFDGMDFASQADIYPGIDGHEKKLPILYFDQLVNEALAIGDLLSVAEALIGRGRKVYVFHKASAVQRLIFRRDVSGLINVIPAPLLSFMFLLEQSKTGFSRFGGKARSAVVDIRQFARRLGGRGPEREAPEKSQRDSEPMGGRPNEEPHVAFFPHLGMIYHNLFYKDHYYSDDPQSPFHPKRILHVELQSQLRPESLAYYKDNEIRFVHLSMALPMRAEIATTVAKAMLRFWRDAGAVKERGLSRARWAAVAAMFRGYLQFFRGHRNFQELGGIKVALLGYDMLFPPALALALQSRGIKVAAVQERMIHVFHGSFHGIFDVYYVSGERVRERLAASPFCCIDEMPLLGLIRSALLRRYREERPTLGLNAVGDTDKLVVVLDFPSNPDAFSDGDNSIICWKANKAFYEDILRLAEANPRAYFVIRGKNDNWCSMPYFADIKKKIDAAANIEISHKYDEVNVSYQLVAQSDLVIGRQSSLGDEAISVGIPTLFIDWTPMREQNIKGEYDYAGCPVFVHNFADLQQRTKSILDGGEYMAESDLQAMCRDHFINPPVEPQKAMQDHLHALMAE